MSTQELYSSVKPTLKTSLNRKVLETVAVKTLPLTEKVNEQKETFNLGKIESGSITTVTDESDIISFEEDPIEKKEAIKVENRSITPPFLLLSDKVKKSGL